MAYALQGVCELVAWVSRHYCENAATSHLLHHDDEFKSLACDACLADALRLGMSVQIIDHDFVRLPDGRFTNLSRTVELTATGQPELCETQICHA